MLLDQNITVVTARTRRSDTTRPAEIAKKAFRHR